MVTAAWALHRLELEAILRMCGICPHIQIEEAGIKQMRACAGDLVGQDRELYQRMIMGTERIVEKLRDEKKEIN